MLPESSETKSNSPLRCPSSFFFLFLLSRAMRSRALGGPFAFAKHPSSGKGGAHEKILSQARLPSPPPRRSSSGPTGGASGGPSLNWGWGGWTQKHNHTLTHAKKKQPTRARADQVGARPGNCSRRPSSLESRCFAPAAIALPAFPCRSAAAESPGREPEGARRGGRFGLERAGWWTGRG